MMLSDNLVTSRIPPVENSENISLKKLLRFIRLYITFLKSLKKHGNKATGL